MSEKGILYIVATPIGNMQDITLRAIDALRDVDIIVCEDTRVTGKLLGKYDIKKPLMSLNEFNEEQVVYQVISKLSSQNIALVSDAGTPLISDPGFRLVRSARQKGFRVIPIPGASAIIAALCASGLPTDKFLFLGFLPKSKQKISNVFSAYKNLPMTIVTYESPHRITQTLLVLQEVYGDIHVTIARELTKIHEEIVTKKVSEFISEYSEKEPKGELVLLFNYTAT